MQLSNILLPLFLTGLVGGNLVAQTTPPAPAAAPPSGQQSVQPAAPSSPEAPPAPPAGQAVEPVPAQSRVFTGSRTVEAGDVIDEIIVVGGDLRVRGEVTGNAVVVGGDLILESSGVILGDAIVTGGRLVNEGGRVRGEMRSINGQGAEISAEIQRSVSGQAVTEERERPSSQAALQSNRRVVRERFSFFGPIRRGVAGIVSTVALGLVLAGVGATLVFYGRPYLETVSDTARGSTLRSGATGLAATFLAVPAFVVMVVALAVSIVGIPFLLVAIPLYPLALFAGAVFGLLAVSHALGERTAEQGRDAFDLRYRNSYAYLFTGLGMLLMPHIAAHLISMTGFLGFIGTLLRVVTWMAIWVAMTIGFGAVILSRAGTRRTFVPPSPDSSIFDSDDFLGEDSLGEPSNA